jgi:hypothetical protein
VRNFSIILAMALLLPTLGGCAAPGSMMVENNLYLSITVDDKPLQNYEVTVKRPRWYGQHPMDKDFNSREFVSADFKTDSNGQIYIHDTAIHHITVWLIPPIPVQTKIQKPMYFINFKDMQSCDLVLWYLEDKDYFVPLIYQNGHIGNMEFSEDVTGSFTKTKKGWDISATINRIDRICP